jgi:hypothetical protein
MQDTIYTISHLINPSQVRSPCAGLSLKILFGGEHYKPTTISFFLPSFFLVYFQASRLYSIRSLNRYWIVFK